MMNCPHCSTANPDFATSCKECSTPLLSINDSDSETIQMVDPSAIALGSDFGTRYRIESLLGQGGMGRVYKAYDKELDRTVAIKVVREGAIGQADALKRFKQELVLASKISHKNILRIHDMGEVAGVRFISMAYIQGKDLQHIIKENPKMPLERVLKFSQQIAEALAAAHAEGVVHRDLKPQNLLIGNDDQVFVCDFGLAKSFEESAIGMTRTGAFLGTPRYMSPEQVEGKPADQRADLYAFGLILYEMVTGDVPFVGESTLKVMYQRIQEKPKSPKLINADLPNWLVRIIMRCLEKDPADRYQSAYEILADLQGGRGQSSSGGSGSGSRGGISRSGDSIQIQLPEFASRRSVWIPSAAAVVLLIVGAIFLVRHFVQKGGGGGGGGGGDVNVSGIPPLSSGRFIAILPIQVLGDASQIGYLAQGVEEALSTKLFQVKDVRVTSSDEADKIDQKQSSTKIARALGANYLVQGTLQGSGDRIRVTMRLQDALHDKRVWSKEFDGVSSDLFTLEDQIYGDLVSALNVNLTTEEVASSKARPTENAAAYDLYVRGRNALRAHDSKSIQSALDYFDQALKADPKFALAFAGEADASLRMYDSKKDNFWTQKALTSAQAAEQINDKLPEVHSVLGSAYIATGKYAQAVTELKRAISLAPSSDEAYRRLGGAYLASGDYQHAIEAFQKAVDLNSYFWVNQNALGDAYFRSGDYAKSLLAFQQVTVLAPDIDAGFENIGNVYAQQGKYQEAIPYFQKALAIEPYFSTYSNLGTCYFFLKQYPQAAEMFEKAVALNANDTLTAVNLADSYRFSGQKDKAHAAYQQAVSLGYKELQTNPQNSDVMAQIALSYANLGQAQQADTFIKKARAIDKTSLDYIYDQVQIYALLGETKEALDALREALEKHYAVDAVAADPNVDSLRSNPEYNELIKKYSAKKP
jgi:tetratricopeptide (TPR) repeat protein/TolB-like protein/tRNA A-37 threonylcarbamoyl transferase component Bud32